MAEVISVTQPAPATTGVTVTILDQILKLWWLWLLIIAILGLIAFFVIKFIMQIKEDEDEILKLFKERKKLCKTHRNKRYYKAFFRKTLNAPIKCMWTDGTRWHKKTVGYYYGDYYTKEGNLILAFMKERSSVWFILPDIALLILNKRASKTIKYKDSNKQEVTIEQKLPTDIEEFLEDEIVLKAVSIDKLDREGKWFVPILQAVDGTIINPTAYTFEQFKDVLIGEYLLTNMNDALQQSKKALDMNQWIRGKQKMEDKSQSIEQPNQ